MKAKWKRRALAAAVLAAAAWFFHAPLLTALAGLLVADQPPGEFNYICILNRALGPNGYHSYDVAGELFRQLPSRRVLLVGPSSGRLVEIGVLPSFEELGRSGLARRGVPPDAISVATGEGGASYRAAAYTLSAWLRDHPDASPLLLCPQFHSAQMRRDLDAVLGVAEAGRVRLRALPNPHFDPSNWWHCRPGVRGFGVAWLMRLQGLLGGGQAAQPPQTNADQYERDFLRALEESTP